MKYSALASIVAAFLLLFVTTAVSQNNNNNANEEDECAGIEDNTEQRYCILEREIRKTRQAELDKPISNVAEANCNLTIALTNSPDGLEGFRSVIESAKSNYKESSEAIKTALEDAVRVSGFDQEVSVSDSLLVLLRKTNSEAPATQLNVLALIAQLAEESAKALEDLQNNAGDGQSLAIAINNAAIITRLIAAFYTLEAI